jgi:hypothetical protein
VSSEREGTTKHGHSGQGRSDRVGSSSRHARIRLQATSACPWPEADARPEGAKASASGLRDWPARSLFWSFIETIFAAHVGPCVSLSGLWDCWVPPVEPWNPRAYAVHVIPYAPAHLGTRGPSAACRSACAQFYPPQTRPERDARCCFLAIMTVDNPPVPSSITLRLVDWATGTVTPLFQGRRGAATLVVCPEAPAVSFTNRYPQMLS